MAQLVVFWFSSGFCFRMLCFLPCLFSCLGWTWVALCFGLGWLSALVPLDLRGLCLSGFLFLLSLFEWLSGWFLVSAPSVTAAFVYAVFRLLCSWFFRLCSSTIGGVNVFIPDA